MKRGPLILSALCFGGILAGCGTYSPALRMAVRSQSHREIVLIPLERKAGTLPYSAQATQMLNERLMAAGFTVTETMPKPGAWTSRRRAIRAARKRPHALVLVGQLEDAAQTVEHHSEEYDYQNVPAPRCCTDALKPCQQQPEAYDDLFGTVVNACLGSHKRVKVRSAGDVEKAAFALRLRLLSTDTVKPIWEGTGKRDGEKLDPLADAVLTEMVTHLAETVVRLPTVPQTASR